MSQEIVSLGSTPSYGRVSKVIASTDQTGVVGLSIEVREA